MNLTNAQRRALRSMSAKGAASIWSTTIKAVTFEGLYGHGLASKMTVNGDHHIYDITEAGRKALEGE